MMLGVYDYTVVLTYECIDFDGRNAVFYEWLSENGDCLSGTVRIL